MALKGNALSLASRTANCSASSSLDAFVLARYSSSEETELCDAAFDSGGLLPIDRDNAGDHAVAAKKLGFKNGANGATCAHRLVI